MWFPIPRREPAAATCSPRAARPAGSWPRSTGRAPPSARSSRGRPACASPSARCWCRASPWCLTWGPDFLQFYNDAYAPLIGAKHPAIGEDIRRHPRRGLGRARAADRARDDHARGLVAARPAAAAGARGLPEETYFTVSHAPAFDDDGRVAGMHAVCTEVTGEVLSARRQRLLHELATAGARLGRRVDDGRGDVRGRSGRTRWTCRSRRSTSPTAGRGPPADGHGRLRRRRGCPAPSARTARSWTARRAAGGPRRTVGRPGDPRPSSSRWPRTATPRRWACWWPA